VLLVTRIYKYQDGLTKRHAVHTEFQENR